MLQFRIDKLNFRHRITSFLHGKKSFLNQWMCRFL